MKKMNRQIAGLQIGLALLLSLALLLGLGGSVTLVQAQEQNTNPLRNENLENIDPDNYDMQAVFQPGSPWIVVEKWNKTYKDPKSGLTIEEYYERRHSPEWWPVSEKALELCNQNDNPNVTCEAVGDDEVLRTTKAKKSDTDYVQQKMWNAAHKLCDTAGCVVGTFYAMYRTQYKWVRTSSVWNIKNAKLTWGCPATCIMCSGGIYSYVRYKGPANAVWSGNQSVMVTDSYSFAEGLDFGPGQETAKVLSDAYYNNVKFKTISTQQTWN